LLQVNEVNELVLVLDEVESRIAGFL
jgi:hypothetical protein